ncbi:Vacuolar protein sorting protein [Trypanosoma rangeli]|uniref:Vacuolar protein sorting protein n=1 Tax=Trypanosoma rangeli TaxID=5698 RepID=A0A422NVH8_TRYRA|nr:Vacuolar protein sorting protein [Trypanosoma rangeli]RNF09454.1 Vacuolar protein sorting protein [Trypanosoma rangeli]|eukprot:RNF09454.1 Vacuolar protein sorting protein [Trypanosoma rangeli]
MTTVFTKEELEDLAYVDLDDDFVERNVRNQTFDAELSRRAAQEACDDFVRTFLGDDEVPSLHLMMRECDSSLAGIERVLERFIVNLESVQHDIGDVRERLKRIGVSLTNTSKLERALWSVVSRLIVPPEVVRIIIYCNDEELGPQLKLSMQQLLMILRYRKEGSCRIESDAETRISFDACKIYAELTEVLDRLTVHACVKTKRFLSKKLAYLNVRNTNVYIQQEHVLKPYAFYVHFLRSAASLLRRPQERDEVDPGAAELLPFCITKALYDELRCEYCAIMSQLYLDRFQHYVMTLNAMEKSTQTVYTGTAQVAYVLPLLVELQEATPSSTFELGERAGILNAVLAQPLVPLVEHAKQQLHFYEETFRSLNVLLCDAVTHEFLFTFAFFSGDMSVFVDVFKPTIQFFVDYVSEVLLGQNDGTVRRLMREKYPQASVNPNCRYDCYGLLLLVRLCHEFRSFMRDVRRLSCLEGFYDSLLLLLWPAFQRTYERQMLSLRSADAVSLSRVLLRTHSGHAWGWVKCVHPLSQHYAGFVQSLVTIGSGCGFDEFSDNDEPSRSFSSVDAVNGTTAAANLSNTHEISFAELRRLAWRAIEAERASDAADSASRFAVLTGNLSFMRVEVLRLLREMGQHVAAGDTKHPETHEMCVLAFLLNNVRAILRPWNEYLANNSSPSLEEDYRALEEVERVHRSGFVDAQLRMYFPFLYGVVHQEEVAEMQLEKLLESADAFTRNWKRELDNVCGAVRTMIADPVHEGELLAQVCMEVLLRNTRLHGCVSRVLAAAPSQSPSAASDTDGVNRPIRSFVVTNQQMLQHMRTLATMPEDEEGVGTRTKFGEGLGFPTL